MHSILIIEDDTDYRASLMEILEFEKYAPLGAENGVVGLQMIRQHSPGVIFCDVDMPVMNGIEVLRSVKADPELAKIPFIVTTGRNDLRTRQTASALGAELYLLKPVTIPQLLATIVHFLQASYIGSPSDSSGLIMP